MIGNPFKMLSVSSCKKTKHKMIEYLKVLNFEDNIKKLNKK